MYSAQATNGLGVTDGSGTINPAALNSSGKITARYRAPRARCDALLPAVHYRGVADILGPHLGALAHSAASISPDTSPRGVKRSRSPDTYGDLPADDNFGEDGMLIPPRDGPRPRPRPLPRDVFVARGAGRWEKTLLMIAFCGSRLETTKTRSPDETNPAFSWRAREPQPAGHASISPARPSHASVANGPSAFATEQCHTHTSISAQDHAQISHQSPADGPGPHDRPAH